MSTSFDEKILYAKSTIVNVYSETRDNLLFSFYRFLCPELSKVLEFFSQMSAVNKCPKTIT